MNLRKIVKSNEFFLFAVIALMCIVFGLVSPSFFTVKNLFDILKSMTETAAYADAIRAKSFWMRTKRLIRSPITLSVRRDMVRSPICLSRWRFPSLGICSA